MKRRELFRRTILGAAGSALTSSLPGDAMEASPTPRQFPRDQDASKDLSRPDWKPAFLDEHQNKTLIVLSDLMIPRTDTPGAREALVNRFIDRLLAAEGPEARRGFLASLTYVDGECIARYGDAFVHLPVERQVEFLKFIAFPHNLTTWGDNRSEFGGHTHFLNLKRWISQAFYGSEIGMKELGWDDNVFHGDFEGCPHPEKSHE